jgi:uncharacterized protein YodC (DUF2158 family)
MAEEFKPGAMVRHKTGGPTMVVTGYTYGMVKCWWPGKTHHGQDFTEETLEPAKHEPKTAPALEHVAQQITEEQERSS